MNPRRAAACGEVAGAAWGAAEVARASRRAEAVRRNLGVALDRAPTGNEIRAVFATFGRSLAAFAAAPAARGRWREIAGAVEADRLGPGILLSPHLGAWELGSTILAAAGAPCASLVRRMGRGDRLYDRLRGAVETIPVDRPRGVLRAVAEGKTVCFAMDEPPPPGAPAIRARFFGREVAFAEGAFRLARAAQAPLYAAAGIWNARGLLDIPVLGPFDADDVAGAIGGVESLIRRAPAQWVLFAPRFD